MGWETMLYVFIVTQACHIYPHCTVYLITSYWGPKGLCLLKVAPETVPGRVFALAVNIIRPRWGKAMHAGVFKDPILERF